MQFGGGCPYLYSAKIPHISLYFHNCLSIDIITLNSLPAELEAVSMNIIDCRVRMTYLKLRILPVNGDYFETP
jgi:hypothetical protein